MAHPHLQPMAQRVLPPDLDTHTTTECRIDNRPHRPAHQRPRTNSQITSSNTHQPSHPDAPAPTLNPSIIPPHRPRGIACFRTSSSPRACRSSSSGATAIRSSPSATAGKRTRRSPAAGSRSSTGSATAAIRGAGSLHRGRSSASSPRTSRHGLTPSGGAGTSATPATNRSRHAARNRERVRLSPSATRSRRPASAADRRCHRAVPGSTRRRAPWAAPEHGGDAGRVIGMAQRPFLTHIIATQWHGARRSTNTAAAVHPWATGTRGLPLFHGARTCRVVFASRLAEDREASLLGESIHRVLDRGLDLAVDRVDVRAIVDALWVGVDVNRVEQFGADLRRQRKVRRNRSRSSARRGCRARSATAVPRSFSFRPFSPETRSSPFAIQLAL